MGSGGAVSLGGKVMIVTGASSGIGRAVARRFAEEGVKQVLVARSVDKLKALASEISGETLTVAADLIDPGATATVMEATGKRFGAVDILFANAGSYIAGDVADGNPDDWDKLLTLNINAVFRTVHAVLPGMIAR